MDNKYEGNVAMMHEALLIVKRLFDGRIMFQPAIRKAHKAVDAALAAPPRNCDVGMAEEQFERMFVFCRHKGKCARCEHHKIGTLFRECALRWAQMPYEEGGKRE